MDRDNPQEIGYIAWLAGIIDGEGSIGLLVSERRERPHGIDIRLIPRIIIANTDAGIIDRCLDAFRVIGVGHYIQHKRHAARRVVGIEVKLFKPVTTLEVSGLKRVDTLLKAVTPWLAGSGEKKERAELLLALLKRRFEKCREGIKKASNIKYDEEDYQVDPGLPQQNEKQTDRARRQDPQRAYARRRPQT